MLPMVKTVMAMKPAAATHAPCQDVVWTGDDIDLGKLPIQMCWPGEPAPLITWPLVVTQGADDKFNLGIYRMQVTGRDTTLDALAAHRGGAQHFARWQREHPGEPMPVAAVIGADPGTVIAAVTPVPETLSEYQFAGLLRGKKLEPGRLRPVPLKVPADAEIVIEGHATGSDRATKGPTAITPATTTRSNVSRCSKSRAITMRRDPIYLSTFTGRPPDEPSVLGEALNEVFVPLLQQQFPEIVDFWLPPEGC